MTGIDNSDSDTHEDNFQDAAIISAGTDDGADEGWFLFSNDNSAAEPGTKTNNSIQFALSTKGDRDSNENRVQSKTVVEKTGLDVGTWYHVVATYDGRNMRLFVNGVEEAVNSTGQKDAVDYPEDDDNHGGVTIGRFKDSDENSLFKGNISDVAIYNRALTGAEIQTHFNSRTSTAYADNVLGDRPTAWYRLNEMTGTTAVDSSGNARDAIRILRP